LESFVRIGKLELNECKDNEYLIHTVVDSLYSSLIDSIDSIVQSLFDNLKSSSAKSGIIDYVLLSLIAFDLVICLIVDIIFTKYIANYQVKIMDIFLDIPRKYTLFLNNQCETYLAELQVLFSILLE